MTYFKSISYEVVKLLVTQFAMTIYGLVVLMTVTKWDTAFLIVGIFSVLLYFFLIYSQMWELGGGDRIRVDAGRQKKDFIKPLAMGIYANLPNLIFAVMEIVSYFAAPDSAVYTVSHAATHLMQSFYTGVTRSIGIMNNPFTYAVTPFITIFVILFGYILGYHNFYLLPISKKIRENRKSTKR